MFAEDGKGNVGVETRSFRVVPPAVDGTNIAKGRPATASSFDPYNGNFTPGQATDGDYATRWASSWTDDEWIQVDLGSVRSFSHGPAGLGVRVRQGLPHPDVERRDHLDDPDHGHRRRRERRHPERQRLGPLRAGARDSPRHRVRLLAVRARASTRSSTSLARRARGGRPPAPGTTPRPRPLSEPIHRGSCASSHLLSASARPAPPVRPKEHLHAHPSPKHHAARTGSTALAAPAPGSPPLVATALVGVGDRHPTASAAPVNISQGKLATSSSAEGPDFTASKAVDGNNSTRWASQFSDAQWIQVDLGAHGHASTASSCAGRPPTARRSRSSCPTNGTTWTTVATVTNGTGGNQTVTASGTRPLRAAQPAPRAAPATATRCGSSRCSARAARRTPPYTPKPLPPAPPGADTTVTHHEFQANCTPTHTLPDDPIVYPGQAGASHSHTFMGNRSTNANTTTASLLAANSTSCTVPQDKSAYWFPTLCAAAHRSSPADDADHLLQDRDHRLQEGPPVPAGSAVRRRQHDGDAGRVPERPRRGRGLRVREQLVQLGHPGELPAGLAAQRPLPGTELLGRHQPRLGQPQEPHGVPGQR